MNQILDRFNQTRPMKWFHALAPQDKILLGAVMFFTGLALMIVPS